MTDSDPADGSPQDGSKPVPVAETNTAEEAFMLQHALRDEGIDVMIQEKPDPGPLPGFMMPAPQLMSAKRTFFVAPEDAERAERVVQRFVQESRRKALQKAFDPQVLEETLNDIDAPVDLLEMEDFRRLDPGVRREQLARRIAGWLADGLDELEIARRIAASGLSLQEARILMKEVVLEEQHRLKQAREDRLQTSHSFMGIGAALFVVAGIVAVLMLVSGSAYTLIYGICVWLIMIGAAICCWGAVVKSRAAPFEERKLVLLAEDMPGDGAAQEGAAK